MIRLFLRSLAAQLRTGFTLFVLTVIGVALGVAAVLSIQIINRSALGAFEGSLRSISGDADLTVLSRVATLPEALFPRVLADPDVAAAWPVYRLDVALVAGDETFLEIVGVDPFSAMRIPLNGADDVGVGTALNGPGHVALSPKLAKRYGWQPGTSFEVTSGSRRVELTVGALVDFTRITPLAGSRLVLMDIAQAQDRFGGRGVLHQIDVQAVAGADLAALQRRLEERLGSAVQVRTPEQRRDDANDLLAAFRLNLTSLSLISLFVGAFLVHSSTQAALVRRRNELGLLRSLGATRGQLLGLVLAEVVLLASLGVALGIPLGYLAATRNVELVSATLSNLYLLEGIESLQLPPELLVLAAAIGIGGALVGALGPALDLSRRDPRALLAAYTLQRDVAGRAPWLALAGVGIVAVAAIIDGTLLRGVRIGGFVLGVGLLLGLPLCAPWVVGQLTRRIPLRGFGMLYGARTLGLRLQTTAFAVAALAVAVSMLVGITIMIGSFRRTVDIWLGSTLRADVYITTESWRRARAAAVLDPELLAQLDALPDVVAVDRLRQFFVNAGDRRIALSAVDMSLTAAHGRFQLVRGDPEQARRALVDEGAVLISEPLALKERLAPGDRLTLATPGGAREFPIAGVFYDYSSERGGAAMDLTMMTDAFGPGPISNVALYLEPGVDAAVLADRLRSRFADRPLLIRSNREIRQEVFRIFDQTFAVTRLLQGMSLLIAACGIALTLIVLARERVSELALYRALGSRRRQIFRVFLGKGLAIAGFGLLIGALGGVALAAILIYRINRDYFGWTIAVHWPWAELAQGLVLILITAAAASLYPALRASRTPATELTRENL